MGPGDNPKLGRILNADELREIANIVLVSL